MNTKEDNNAIFNNMKKYHNYIKRKLIIDYAKNEETLIDLCCGKGGDMHKWFNAKIKKIIGYDINKEYIEEAELRYNNFKQKNNETKITYKNIDLRKHIIPTEDRAVDVITCNFAFHYFFKNEDTFNNFLKSVTNNLKNNGYFIGAIFDGATVLSKLNNEKVYIYKDFFKIDNLNIKNTLFGNKIKVYLKNSIIDNISTEYIIRFGLFTAEMEKNGFILIDSKVFSELVDEYKGNLDDYEKEFSFLNRYFVFKYAKDTNDTIHKIENLEIQAVENKRIEYTHEELIKWKNSITNDYSINPKTNRKIKKNGKLHKHIKKAYDLEIKDL